MCEFRPLVISNIMIGYSISEYGDVRNDKTSKILHTKKDKDGYLTIMLCVNEIVSGNTHKRKSFRISQLVARTYIGEPPLDMFDPTVDHIDGDIENNHFTNLQWLERGKNSSIRNNKGVGSQNHEAILCENQVYEICNLLLHTELSLQEIANKYNVGKSTISNIKLHKAWTHITNTYDFSCRGMCRDMDGKFKPLNTNLHNKNINN